MTRTLKSAFYCRADEEPDINDFWEEVATNLAANRLRLLFVADEIPAELERGRQVPQRTNPR